MDRISKFSSGLYLFLHKPRKVVFICLCLLMGSLLFNGSLINLYSLHRGRNQLLERISQAKTEVQRLNSRIQVTKDPHFLERQAVDNYDLVSEGDLVFVFSED